MHSKDEEENIRKEKINKRALETLSKSKLPQRLEYHEKAKKA